MESFRKTLLILNYIAIVGLFLLDNFAFITVGLLIANIVYFHKAASVTK